MRRLLTKNYISLAKDYESCVLDKGNNYSKKISPIANLTNLLKSGKKPLKNSNGKNLPQKESELYEEYIKKIISLLESRKLLAIEPQEIEELISTPEFNIGKDLLEKKLRKGTNKVSDKFSNIIISCMQYSDIRNQIMPQFIKKVGIKTCVYCNANYAITDKDNKGYYQLDHFYPKSLYPFLSISFFNLQPCCASCNLNKGDKEEKYFNLWSVKNSDSLDVYKFSLNLESQIRYWISHKADDLSVELSSIKQEDSQTLINMVRDLGLSNIYNEHLDYVEEVLWKMKEYKGYFNVSNDFKELNLTEEEIERFILGNYTSPEDTHKRPLSKLTQDIAEELDLI